MRKVFAVWFACFMILTVAFAAPAEEQPAEAARYAKVATQKGTLNLRAEAKDKAEILDKLPKGSIVNIVEDAGEWTKITYKKNTGYVKTEFLEEIEELPYSLLSQGDKGEKVLAFKRALYSLGYIKSEDINSRYDTVMENAVTKLQLMNGVALDPKAVTPELQALMEWGKLVKYKSGYLDTQLDKETGLMVSVFCWDTGGTLFEDGSVRVKLAFAAQAAGGVPPYTITVEKSLSGKGGDEITSPFTQIWTKDTERLYIFATVVDAAGNTVTACAPYRYNLPD